MNIQWQIDFLGQLNKALENLLLNFFLGISRPVKVMGVEHGVNVTVGLPVIRTSVDHGTAFDIAGTGRADERSMLEALRIAIELAASREAQRE